MIYLKLLCNFYVFLFSAFSSFIAFYWLTFIFLSLFQCDFHNFFSISVYYLKNIENSYLTKQRLKLVIISVFLPNCSKGLRRTSRALLPSSDLTFYCYCISFLYIQITRHYCCFMESVLI